MVLLICSAIFRFYSDLTILQHGRIFFKEILKFLKFLTTFFRSGGSNYVSHVRSGHKWFLKSQSIQELHNMVYPVSSCPRNGLKQKFFPHFLVTFFCDVWGFGQQNIKIWGPGSYQKKCQPPQSGGTNQHTSFFPGHIFPKKNVAQKWGKNVVFF